MEKETGCDDRTRGKDCDEMQTTPLGIGSGRGLRSLGPVGVTCLLGMLACTDRIYAVKAQWVFSKVLRSMNVPSGNTKESG